MKSIGSTGLAYLWEKIKSIIPTKVSDLENDSGFITNAGVTSITTTTGAHTAISNKTGAVSFNVPTKTSHLTNDRGFLTAHQTIYESKIKWGNTGISGSVTPMGASLSSEHSANRIAYLNPAAIQIEYTTNGGSSWTDSGYSDGEKTWLCTGTQSIAIGQSKSGYSNTTALTTNHWTRITLTGRNSSNAYVYTSPKKLLINISTAVGLDCLIECKTGMSEASWQTFGTYTVSGWSAWNDIPLILDKFGGGTSQTSNIWYLRFTFKVTSTRTDNYKGYAQVLGLRLFGATDWGSASSSNGKGPFSSTGHLYSYDVEANATFPAQVQATSFKKTGGTSSQFLKADGSVDSNTYLTSYTETDPTVPSWAKASTKPSYTASEVGALPDTTAIPTESTVSGWGFTKNTGTVTYTEDT